MDRSFNPRVALPGGHGGRLRIRTLTGYLLLPTLCAVGACHHVTPAQRQLEDACVVTVIADSVAHIVFPVIDRPAWLRDTAQGDSMRAPESVWSLYLYDASPMGLHIEVGRGTQATSGTGSLSSYLAGSRVMITSPSFDRAYEFDDVEYVPSLHPDAVGNRVTIDVRGAAYARLFGVHRDTARCDFGGRGLEPVEEYVPVQYVR